jgi:hypothetical protein
MASQTGIWWQRVALVFAGIIVLVTVLVLAEPYVPTTIRFATEDLAARAQYQHIVTRHGFGFRHEKSVGGETVVVIEGITPLEYRKIDCEFSAWSTARRRAAGAVVQERTDCAR